MKKILFLAFFMALFSSCTLIDSAEVGISFSKFSLTDKGEVKADFCSGWVMYNPFTTSIFTYPTFIQRCDYPDFVVTTRDAAEFRMNPMLAYSINKQKAIDVFKKYRVGIKDIEKGYMRTAVYDAYRITANKYASEELMANRANFEAEVREMLNNSLNNEGFVVEEFTSQITPPSSLSLAIEAKNKAIQDALKADNEVKTAEANAKIEIAKAKGKAEALRITADGEAYYNRTIASSLTNMLIQQDAIEKWDGKLPTYSGGGALPFLNINK
ncbi:MAG: SPFH domain-containing protein [Phocaeicola sp.]